MIIFCRAVQWLGPVVLLGLWAVNISVAPAMMLSTLVILMSGMAKRVADNRTALATCHRNMAHYVAAGGLNNRIGHSARWPLARSKNRSATVDIASKQQ